MNVSHRIHSQANASNPLLFNAVYGYITISLNVGKLLSTLNTNK